MNTLLKDYVDIQKLKNCDSRHKGTTNTVSKCIEKRSWHKNMTNMDGKMHFFKNKHKLKSHTS